MELEILDLSCRQRGVPMSIKSYIGPRRFGGMLEYPLALGAGSEQRRSFRIGQEAYAPPGFLLLRDLLQRIAIDQSPLPDRHREHMGERRKVAIDGGSRARVLHRRDDTPRLIGAWLAAGKASRRKLIACLSDQIRRDFKR